MNRPAAEAFVFSWLLPAFLWALTYFSVGFHYETNDDLIMSFIARGIMFGQPVGDYFLYFHGLGNLFVWLYQQFPAVPWYGITLYLLLFISTVLAFRFLYQILRPKLNFPLLIGVGILFYLANWYEHAFWFNYMRVPLLLAALALLHAFPVLNRQAKIGIWKLIGLVFLFFLALVIRPGAALLGVAVVLPFLVFQTFQNRQMRSEFLKATGIFLAAGLIFVLWMQLSTTDQARNYRELDTLKSGMLDFQWCCGEQKDPENKLVLTGLHHWFVADTKVWQPLLEKASPDWSYIFKETLPTKLTAAFQALVLDQFLAVAMLAFLLLVLYQSHDRAKAKWVIVFQVYTVLLLLFFAMALKLPPRVLTPVLGLHLLMTSALISQTGLKFSGFKWYYQAALVLLLSLQVYKIGNRAAWQQEKQQKAERYFELLSNRYHKRLIVLADVGGELRALSPFRNYSFGTNQVLFLTGWQTLDPHFLNYCQQLSGKPEVGFTLQELSRRERVVWLMQPDFKDFLVQYLTYFYGNSGQLNSLHPVAEMPDSAIKIYTNPE